MLKFHILPTLCTRCVHVLSDILKPLVSHLFAIRLSVVFPLFIQIFPTSCAERKPQELLTAERKDVSVHGAVDINSADAAELEMLPRIGPKLAVKIVEHRERFGRFRAKEELMLVDGFSESRFMAIRTLIRAE